MNKTKGDMYSWVSHTWNPLNGQCPHRCRYCMAKRTTAGRMGFYDGPLRLNKNAMAESHGTGRTIFVCALNDLFADGVSDEFIQKIMGRCFHRDNNYVFQSRNTYRMAQYSLHGNNMYGTTVETDDAWICSRWSPGAPEPKDRIEGLATFEDGVRLRTFVTVEPIMRFTPRLIEWLCNLRPDFVNIGADSGRNGLPEPSAADILRLRDMLTMAGVKVNLKSNLGRLLNAP